MSETVLQARDLARFYKVSRDMFSEPATVRALDGASFSLEAGRTLAIVGESGCGKSTLARVLTMIEPATRGELLIDGKPVTESGRSLRQSIQIVFQNPYGSLNPRQKIGAIIEEPVKLNSRESAAERKRRGMEMLERVGLRPEHYERYPHMFSGGQRQRIAIARALMLQPKILVLDEPVSALDVSIQAQVLNILADLQSEFGLAYVFISHDLSVVRHIADDIVIMYLGRVVEHGLAKDIFAAPKHPYTAALLSATPVADPGRAKARIPLVGELPSPLNPPPGCPFNPRCWKAESDCTQSFPPETGRGTHFAACYHQLEDGDGVAS